mmetsp:Transcript_38415/g.113945  ORF Transcript_38415/g.113945 Transcript_38415/m.113945 type:complete len:288 (-) Transcript_38415:926-1789(-)
MRNLNIGHRAASTSASSNTAPRSDRRRTLLYHGEVLAPADSAGCLQSPASAAQSGTVCAVLAQVWGRHHIQQSLRGNHALPKQRVCLQVERRQLRIRFRIAALVARRKHRHPKVGDVVDDAEALEKFARDDARPQHRNGRWHSASVGRAIGDCHRLCRCDALCIDPHKPCVVGIQHKETTLPCHQAVRLDTDVGDACCNMRHVCCVCVDPHNEAIAQVVEHRPHFSRLERRECVDVVLACEQRHLCYELHRGIGKLQHLAALSVAKEHTVATAYHVMREPRINDTPI